MRFQPGHPPIPGCETGGRPRMWTDDIVEHEARLLVEWAKKPDSLVLGRHYGERGYHYWHAMDWSRRNKEFEEAKKLALTLVGSRREEMALLGAIDASIVRKNLGLYDPEVKQYELDLKQKEAEISSQSSEMLSKIFESIENNKNPIKKNEGIA